MSPEGESGEKNIATNRRARFDYQIDERYEAGIVLTGAEVKSLRAGQASLSESFARVQGGEIWLEGMHIARYEQAKEHRDERRPRKLLLHRREIDKLLGKTAEQGLTLVPMRVYLTHGIVKVELGLGRGKRKHEKRQAMAERDANREIERNLGRRR